MIFKDKTLKSIRKIETIKDQNKAFNEILNAKDQSLKKE